MKKTKTIKYDCAEIESKVQEFLDNQLSENEILSFPVTASQVTRTIVIKPED